MLRKLAFLGVKPHMGGTWTVFENLRMGLAQHAIELRWVIAGRKHIAVLHDLQWSEPCEWGEVVASDLDDERDIALVLKDHLLANYDGAIVNVLCDRLCTNLMRYMPSHFPRVMLVHNITIGTYVAARSIRDYVHATVGVSKRVQLDLIAKYGFDANRTHSIPNAVPVERFEASLQSKIGALRILVLSRIENQSKGSFRVPEILRRLTELQVLYECTIVGDGPDLDELKRRCKGLSVQFKGQVPAWQVPSIMATHHAYLFPSNYEGFGLSLVEAMAGGCVPVASLLKGVTDQIVEDQVSGFLLDPEDIDGYVLSLKLLFESPVRQSEMSNAARHRASCLFSVDSVSSKWFSLLSNVQSDYGKTLGRVCSIDDWCYPRGLLPGLRTFLPEPLKNKLRLMRENLSRR
jgi:glycosyltransferase involved in cell wall biosynthesis